MRFLLLTVTLLLTGCDMAAGSSQVLAPIARVRVAGITVDPGTSGTTVDLFVEIQSLSGDSYYRTGVQTGANPSSTLLVDIAAPFAVPSNTAQLRISIFDLNGGFATSRLLAQSETFTAAQVALAAETTIGEAGGGAQFTLTRSVLPN